MDSANVLSQSAKDQLTALCTEVDQKAQAQIAVVTVKSLDGRPIEDYAVDLFARLGIGPKKSDRGVMILFAIDDHRDRVEVGYGLEPILPDGKVGTFEREIVPYLHTSNYDGAILLITRRVADVIAADRGIQLTSAVPPAPAQNRGGTGTGQIIGLLFAIFIFFLFFRGIGGGMGRGSGWWIWPLIGASMGRGGGWSGGGFGGGFGGGGGGFGGFGGGMSGGGGASGSW